MVLPMEKPMDLANKLWQLWGKERNANMWLMFGQMLVSIPAPWLAYGLFFGPQNATDTALAFAGLHRRSRSACSSLFHEEISPEMASF